MAKILFIGDIVGKPGRRALRAVLPEWKEKYQPDVVIVNVENIAHGKGVTINTMANIDDLGIDCYTSGNHVFDKGALSNDAFDKYSNLIRPANYESLTDKNGEKLPVPGHGYYRFEKNGQQYLIFNLNATVFFEKQYHGEISSPFVALDQLLTEQAQKGDIIVVDFHSEATSEKIAFGFYADGKVTAVLGTHTHVPTADARLLPNGTAYISDAGMTGPLNSVIGVKIENSLNIFLGRGKFVMEPEEEGPAMINGVLIETSDKGQAAKIEKLYQEV